MASKLKSQEEISNVQLSASNDESAELRERIKDLEHELLLEKCLRKDSLLQLQSQHESVVSKLLLNSETANAAQIRQLELNFKDERNNLVQQVRSQLHFLFQSDWRPQKTEGECKTKNNWRWLASAALAESKWDHYFLKRKAAKPRQVRRHTPVDEFSEAQQIQTGDKASRISNSEESETLLSAKLTEQEKFQHVWVYSSGRTATQ
jgi:hypothetical protein